MMAAQKLICCSFIFWLTSLPPATMHTEQQETRKIYEPGKDGVTYPHLLVQKKPAYPEEVRQHRLEARVVLDAIVRTDGSVAVRRQLDCKINRKGRYPKKKYERFCPQLFESARLAVSEWKYAPCTLNSEPVDASISVVVDFTLN